MAILKQLHHFLKVLYCAWSISVSAGLPNIEGSFNNIPSASTGGDSTTTGCVIRSSKSKANVSYEGTSYRPSKLGFNIDASNSNSIYGNSETVTPESLTTFLLIKY